MVTPVYQPIGTRAQEGLQNFLATQQAGQQANPEDILLERQYQGFLNQEKKSDLDKLTREGALREILSAIAGIEPILNSIPPNATPEQYQGPKQQMLDYLKQVSPQYSGTAKQGLDAFALKIANNNFEGARGDIESAKAAAQAYFTTGQTGQAVDVRNITGPNPSDNNRIYDGIQKTNKITGATETIWLTPNAKAQIAGETEQAKNPALIDRQAAIEEIKNSAFYQRLSAEGQQKILDAYGLIDPKTQEQQAVGDVKTQQEIEANKGKNIDNSKIKSIEETANTASAANAIITNATKLKQLLEQGLETGGTFESISRDIFSRLGVTTEAQGLFLSLSGQLVLDKVQQMKGALSDKDREFLTQQAPSIDLSVAANRAILNNMIEAASNALNKANSAREQLNSGNTDLPTITNPNSTSAPNNTTETTTNRTPKKVFNPATGRLE